MTRAVLRKIRSVILTFSSSTKWQEWISRKAVWEFQVIRRTLCLRKSAKSQHQRAFKGLLFLFLSYGTFFSALICERRWKLFPRSSWTFPRGHKKNVTRSIFYWNTYVMTWVRWRLKIRICHFKKKCHNWSNILCSQNARKKSWKFSKWFLIPDLKNH